MNNVKTQCDIDILKADVEALKDVCLKNEGGSKMDEYNQVMMNALETIRKTNEMLSGNDISSKEAKERIQKALDDYNKALNEGAEEKLNELEEEAKKEEKKIMELNGQNQKITTKQAFKALGRNFKRWCGEHKWQIGAAVVGSAIATYGWYKSAQIVDGETDGLSGLLDAIEKDAKTNPHYEKQSSGTYRYLGTEHGTQKNDEFKTWMNWKAENDLNLYSTVIIEPMDRYKEFDPKPDQIAELLKSIGEDYAHDYPHREEGIWTDIYADGTSKTVLDDGTVVTEF